MASVNNEGSNTQKMRQHQLSRGMNASLSTTHNEVDLVQCLNICNFDYSLILNKHFKFANIKDILLANPEDKFVLSDVDEQLIINVMFKQPVCINSIAIRADSVNLDNYFKKKEKKEKEKNGTEEEKEKGKEEEKKEKEESVKNEEKEEKDKNKQEEENDKSKEEKEIKEEKEKEEKEKEKEEKEKEEKEKETEHDTEVYDDEQIKKEKQELAAEISGPRTLRLYSNDESIDFVSVEEIVAHQTIELKKEDLGGKKIKLRGSKFQRCNSIQIFVSDNQNETNKTFLNRLAFWGYVAPSYVT